MCVAHPQQTASIIPRTQTTAVTHRIRGIHPVLFQCWTSVEDGGTTMKQHWVNASSLLEYAH